MLLSSGEAPVKQVSATVGLPCLKIFERLFRAATGKIPQEYRRQCASTSSSWPGNPRLPPAQNVY